MEPIQKPPCSSRAIRFPDEPEASSVARGERVLRILFVEDCLADAELAEKELKRDGLTFESRRVDCRFDLLRALANFSPDVIICDYSLPDMDGLEALSLTREHLPETPFIFVSGTIGEDRAVGSLKAGATDYVVKDRLAKLPHAVRRALKEVQDHAERRSLEHQLRQAQKMDAFGQLAGGIAHDFNNLLTAILGCAYLAKTELEAGHPVQKELSEIEYSGSRAAALARKLLAFSRRQILQPQVLNLNAVSADMASLLRRLIGAPIELIQKLQNPLGSVKADPSQLEQVILNLAVNARDAMPNGGHLILETQDVLLDVDYCRGWPGLSPGHYVMLAVSDTGIGMDPLVLSRIFEPFFTTKAPDKGSGLGLSTVYGIVKQHEGHITVSSEFGRGSTFKVYFPRVDAEAKKYKSSLHMSIPKGGHESILVVEDEEPVRNLVRHVLMKAGYSVTVAGSAKEAETALRSAPVGFTLVIMDVVLPGISGADWAARLKTSAPAQKVLCMSGYTEEAVVRQGDLTEGMAFLPKPFTPHALLQAVRNALDSPDSG